MPTPYAGLSGPGQALVPIDWTVLPTPRNVFAKGISASQQFITDVGLLIFADANETSGSAAFLAYLHDGTDTTGEIIAALGAPANSGDVVSPGYPGVLFRNGVYIERVSGTFTISATWIPLLEQPPY